ncbi:MAG: helix-turn-helix transcriptional regulator [Candidatus Wallacebacter cryptica]
MNSFDYFIRHIPKEVLSKHTAVFIPEQREWNLKLNEKEYYFILCFTNPPSAVIRDQEHQFRKGDLICLAPGDDLQISSNSAAAPAHYLTVCVLPEFMTNIYRNLGYSGTLRFDTHQPKYSRLLLEALNAFIHEVVFYEDSCSLMLSSLENRIAIQLIRDARCIIQSRRSPSDSAEAIVRHAIEYIETYFPSHITVQDISDAIYVSPSYLQKIFTKLVGKSPHKYIMECRHRQAKYMLAATKLPMEEVARQCGFVSGAHFSTAFKQMEDMSPLSFRKSQRSCQS